MSVFDIDKGGGFYRKGYMIHESSICVDRDVFIGDIDDTSICVRNNNGTFINAWSPTVDKIIKIGTVEGKDIRFIGKIRFSFDGDEYDGDEYDGDEYDGGDKIVDFGGIVIENQARVEFFYPFWDRLIINNLTIKGKTNKANVKLEPKPYTFNNVCIRNQEKFIWNRDIILKNSQISCRILEISREIGGGYWKIQKLIDQGDFQKIKRSLGIPLDRVKFNKINLGKKSMTWEQYNEI